MAMKGVQDTALWVAAYRAWENERPNPLFRDPFARELAGAEGEAMARQRDARGRNAWAYVLRTHLFDRIVMESVARGVDLVLDLAAGLDARPYRLDLPAGLRWVEVDHPEMLSYKAAKLDSATPRCRVERVPLDLADQEARRALFQRLAGEARAILVITEGLLVYLRREEVQALARDLGAAPAFRWWATDLASPGLLNMIQRQVGADLAAAGAPLHFAPPEGPGFFAGCGWPPAAVHSVFRNAARLGRIPWWMQIFKLLPESSGPQGRRPWSGICLLERRGKASPEA